MSFKHGGKMLPHFSYGKNKSSYINSNHVRATVYVHYFKNLDAYRVGQIYNSEIALQVSQAVFILKYDPISMSRNQLDQRPSIGLDEVEAPSLMNTQPQSANLEPVYNTPRLYPGQHIRKPRNAWIIFRQEMMIKYRDQIGHLHTSEQCEKFVL